MTRPRAFSHEIAGLSNPFLEENWVLDLGWRGGHLKSALGGMERTRVMVFVHADQATDLDGGHDWRWVARDTFAASDTRCKSVADDPTVNVTVMVPALCSSCVMEPVYLVSTV